MIAELREPIVEHCILVHYHSHVFPKNEKGLGIACMSPYSVHIVGYYYYLCLLFLTVPSDTPESLFWSILAIKNITCTNSSSSCIHEVEDRYLGPRFVCISIHLYCHRGCHSSTGVHEEVLSYSSKILTGAAF